MKIEFRTKGESFQIDCESYNNAFFNETFKESHSIEVNVVQIKWALEMDNREEWIKDINVGVSEITFTYSYENDEGEIFEGAKTVTNEECVIESNTEDGIRYIEAVNIWDDKIEVVFVGV